MAVAVQNSVPALHDSTNATEETSAAVSSCSNLPSSQALQQAGELSLLSADGQSHKFKSLYENRDGRHLIIFVRHFYCGMCQNFLRSLSASVTPKELETCDPPAAITIIGCGEPWLIEEYATRTNCKFPMYTDPTRKLYDVFGMTSTLSAGHVRPSYQEESVLSVATKSFVQVISAGTNMFKGGSFSQVGADFIFEDGNLTWAHFMTTTRDHTSVPEIRQRLGLP